MNRRSFISGPAALLILGSATTYLVAQEEAAEPPAAEVSSQERGEFDQARALPLYRDPQTYAVLFLLLGFACFCIFLDGLLAPERREYFVYALLACVVSLGIGLLCARSWFFQGPPHLGWVLLAPAVLIVLAIVTGATTAAPAATPTEQRQKIYVVGKRPAGTTAPRQSPTGPPRGSLAPGRTVRRAPMPRPPLPPRRPPMPPPPRRPPPPAGGPKPGGPTPPGGDKS